MRFARGASMDWKRMWATFTGFVDDLDGIHLLLSIDAHLHHLAVFGENIIHKFHAAWTAGGSTFFVTIVCSFPIKKVSTPRTIYP
jgi:hypothetical protein